MIPLAILAVIAGWFEHSFVEFVTRTLPTWEAHNLSHSTEWMLILVTSAIAIGGVLFAVLKYKNGGFSKSWEDTAIYKLLINQYYIPKFYEVFVSKPYYAICVWTWKVIEIKLIDASVDGIAHFINKLGVKARTIQSGNLSSSLKLMVLGLILGLTFALVLSVI